MHGANIHSIHLAPRHETQLSTQVFEAFPACGALEVVEVQTALLARGLAGIRVRDRLRLLLPVFRFSTAAQKLPLLSPVVHLDVTHLILPAHIFASSCCAPRCANAPGSCRAVRRRQGCRLSPPRLPGPTQSRPAAAHWRSLSVASMPSLPRILTRV